MVKIQLDLPEEGDKKLQHYMIDNGIKDKRIAVIRIIGEYFKIKQYFQMLKKMIPKPKGGAVAVPDKCEMG